MKKSYSAIDIMKFIAAIFVVYIHTVPFEKINLVLDNTILSISKIAVPFFFVTSGFLFFRNIHPSNQNKTKLIKYLKRIITIYLIWSIFYLPFSMRNLSNLGLMKGTAYYIRNFFFIGSFFQLWYFPALIFAIGFVYLLYRRFSIKQIIVFSLVLYGVGLLGNAYSIMIPEGSIFEKLLNIHYILFGKTRNGLFEGTLFVAIGLCLSKTRISISSRKNMLLLVTSVILLVIESHWLISIGVIRTFDISIFLVPTVFLLVNLLLNMELKQKEIYITLRNISTLIFLIHKFFIELFTLFNISGIQLFILTFVFSIVFSLFVLKLSKAKNSLFIKKAY